MPLSKMTKMTKDAFYTFLGGGSFTAEANWLTKKDNSGFTSRSPEEAGYSYTELRNAGYSLDDLFNFGFYNIDIYKHRMNTFYGSTFTYGGSFSMSGKTCVVYYPKETIYAWGAYGTDLSAYNENSGKSGLEISNDLVNNTACMSVGYNSGKYANFITIWYQLKNMRSTIGDNDMFIPNGWNSTDYTPSAKQGELTSYINATITDGTKFSFETLGCYSSSVTSKYPSEVSWHTQYGNFTYGTGVCYQHSDFRIDNKWFCIFRLF